MKITKSITKFFSRFNKTQSSSTNTVLSKSITSNLAGYLIDLSQFQNMKDEDVYENLYSWSAEVGGAIDRSSSLVRQAINGFKIVNAGDELDDIEKEMLREAELIGEQIEYKDLFESMAELLYIQGNIFIQHRDDISFTILPNKYCNVIDDKKTAGLYTNRIMFEPNFLAFNEMSNSELETIIIPKEKFTQIKYKNTPVMVTDSLNRKTFGLYSVSPINRAVLSVWWARQLQIIDVLLRWRNLPREHHQIDSQMFSLDKFQGSISEKQAASQSAFNTYAEKYAENVNNQTPDQGYITPDTIKIDMIDGDGGYMESNALLEQLNSYVSTSLNMPRSVVDGTDSGSYASQLVISNYVSSKVIQIAEKIKPVILKNIRNRLLKVNKNFPVDNLDIKLEIILATTQLEIWRQASIMSAMGLYTEKEIRELTSYEPLREDQRQFIVNTSTNANTSGTETPAQATRNASNGGGMTTSPDYPMTEGARQQTMYDDVDNMFDRQENI